MNKVFITSYGAVTPLGTDVESNVNSVINHDCAINFVEEYAKIEGLRSHIAAHVPTADYTAIPRTARRTMSPMSLFTCKAVMEAMKAISLDVETIRQKKSCLILGSTSGSPIELDVTHSAFYKNHSTQGQMATSVFKCMSHTLTANVAAALNLRIPSYATNAACSSSSQAIVLGAELIEAGLYDLIIAGGAEEANYTTVMSFDTAQAACTTFNHSPKVSSRPFDSKRSGIVASEGGAVVILMSEKLMKELKINPKAMVRGFANMIDGTHMSQPNVEAMGETMTQSLNRAQLKAQDIHYINAHATSTVLGDLQEAKAIHDIFQDKIPVSSYKGHFGHTFGACGALEVIVSIEAMKRKILIKTLNLEEVAADMAPLNYLKQDATPSGKIFLSNNFGFGGVSTSLIIEGL